MDKPIIYQLLPRLWGNMNENPVPGASIEVNGTGKFSGVDEASLEYLRWIGCSHVWYTGVIRHATKETSAGCLPSAGEWVKGRAGSPYSITDYYDVNPYLADDPQRRMEEFEDLVKRTHDAGLKVIIDFVPNHVARDYGKVSPVPGHPVLGAEDDKNVHWSPDNDFFYYPGQPLRLPVAPAPGCAPYDEMPAMATGNNCYTPAPGINDWYDTVKINYCDTRTRTWDKMLDIVLFWCSKGVDGFRCDMAELVPAEFLGWMISSVKQKYPGTIFIAEVYQKELYRKYIYEAGFDYLYDKSGLYDTLRTVVEKNADDSGLPVELWQSAEGITRNWQFLGDLQAYMLNFLENHDEQRFASDFFGKKASASFAALHVSLLLNRAPFMLYMGEELGERGMDAEGFSGRDGRTSIFDWWSVGSLRKLYKLIHSGEYKGMPDSQRAEASTETPSGLSAGLTDEEAAVFSKYSGLLRMAAGTQAIKSGAVYDLCYCNAASAGFDKSRHFAFLRHSTSETLLIAANFSQSDASMELSIPGHAFEWLGIEPTAMLNPETKIRVDIPAASGTVFKLK